MARRVAPNANLTQVVRLALLSRGRRFDSVGEEVVAEVKSMWCCLDSVSKRPARLAKDIAARFLAD